MASRTATRQSSHFALLDNAGAQLLGGHGLEPRGRQERGHTRAAQRRR